MSSPHVGQAEDRQQLAWIGGSTVEVVLGAEHTGGQLAVMTTRMRRGDASPVHVHSREDEVFFMLQGEGTFWVGDDRYVLAEGGVAWLPRDLPHAYRIDSEEAHVMTLATPGGLEGFFRAAGHDRATPVPDGWAVTPASMVEAFAAHGGTILGPPKGPDA